MKIRFSEDANVFQFTLQLINWISIAAILVMNEFLKIRGWFILNYSPIFIQIIPVLFHIENFKSASMKTANFFKQHPKIILILFIIIGASPIIVETIQEKNLLNLLTGSPHYVIGNVIVVPLIIYCWLKYALNLNNWNIKLKLGYDFFAALYTILTIFMIYHWNIYSHKNAGEIPYHINMIFNILSLVAIISLAVYFILYVVNAILKKDMIIESLPIPFTPFFLMFIFLFLWGMVQFYYTDNPIEPTYEVTIVIYSGAVLLMVVIYWIKFREKILEHKIKSAILLSTPFALTGYSVIGSMYEDNLGVTEKATAPSYIFAIAAMICILSIIIFAIIYIYDMISNSKKYGRRTQT